MSHDETEIRRLVSTWMSATQAGDVAAVMGLMTDDVVFLVPGKAPMRKKDFEATAKAQAAHAAPKFEGSSEIQEVQVNGDLAFAWSKLTVVATPPAARPPAPAPGTHSPCSRRWQASGCWRATPISWGRRSSSQAGDGRQSQGVAPEAEPAASSPSATHCRRACYSPTSKLPTVTISDCPARRNVAISSFWSARPKPVVNRIISVVAGATTCCRWP